MSENSDINVNKTEILFKKYLGYVNTGLPVATEYADNASPYILGDRVYTQNIPIKPSTSNIVNEVITYSYKKTDASNTESKTYTKTYSNDHPYIVKYTDVLLRGLSSNPNIAFIYQEIGTNKNLLKNAISSNFDIGGSYSMTVMTNSGIVIPPDKYILDRDVGLLTFYNYKDI